MFGSALKGPHCAGAEMVPKASTAPGCAVHRPPYTRRVDEHSGRRLARSTAIFSLATGLSRILGLVREVVASYYFGAAGKINAFTVAFQVPNLVRALVADAALQSAFVPVFTELLEKGDRRRAWRVASSPHDRREALRLRGVDRHRDRDPGAPADAVATRSRRATARADRLARPCRLSRAQADGAGDARPRADQLQRGGRLDLRVEADRP